MDQLTHVYDCTGCLIFFGEYVIDYQSNSIKLTQDQYLQAVEIISAPALIFELNNNCPWRYYYRVIGLNKPSLIGVNFNNGIWKLEECFEETSISFLLALLKQRSQDGRITIYVENEIVDDDLGIPN